MIKVSISRIRPEKEQRLRAWLAELKSVNVAPLYEVTLEANR